MTHIDFYLLGKNSNDGGDRVACRLAEKAFRLGHRVYMYTDDIDACKKLDELLWTFSANSFVPHTLGLGAGELETPVCIGDQEPPTGFEDILISMSKEVPSFFSRFERVAEVVGASDSEKQQARARYRYYRGRGYELQTHDL
ncbi:MAG: DNA polymerase III subunit chi [Acidiferrobacterales bacterium]